MECNNACGVALTGRQKGFCSDKCRMSFKRKVEQEPEQAKSDKPEQGLTAAQLYTAIARYPLDTRKDSVEYKELVKRLHSMSIEEKGEFMGSLKWAYAETQGSGAYSLDRSRPYDGQSHTDGGVRGKQEVHGVTIRDVADCVILAFLSCAGMERECPIRDDIYSIPDLNELDPGAVVQNAVCNIEKMMGIYPNVPELK